MTNRGKFPAVVVLCVAVLIGACSSDIGGREAAERLQDMGTLSYLIATPSAGECEVLASRDDETLVALASVFKLYVLGALVDAVRAGRLSWDDPIQIREEFDSLGGTTSKEEPGTELPVRELAIRMISESDNTATDHLMNLVGREAVEQIQPAMGHAQPSVNVPMPTTREVTILIWSGDADLAERYSSAAADERRTILDEEVANRPFPSDEHTESPGIGWLDFGWFGTPGDACRALSWLAEDDEALAVLTNDPLSPNPDLWPVLGFKGGSGNGIATAAWWMETRDGQSHAAVISLVNPTSELDLDSVVELMVSLRDEPHALLVE
jgi:hypothetical protein